MIIATIIVLIYFLIVFKIIYEYWKIDDENIGFFQKTIWYGIALFINWLIFNEVVVEILKIFNMGF